MRVWHSQLSRGKHRPRELRRSSSAIAPSARIADLEPYEVCRVVAVVESLKIDPLAASIEATVTDGTGRLVARWSLVRPTPQLVVVPGRRVLLEGMTSSGESGLVLIDPRFVTIHPAVGT